MILNKEYKAIIYTTRTDHQSPEAILELENYGIHYLEKRLDIRGITKEEVEILARDSENGIMDLVARQSKEFKRIKSRVLDMNYKQLVHHISENPSILKTPIIYSNKKMIIGYSKEEVENFASTISGKRKKVIIDD